MSAPLTEYLGYFRQMLAGALVNLELFALSVALTLLVGMVVGIVTLSRNVVVRLLWRLYSSIIMGVPSLLVILVIYYGGSSILGALPGGLGQLEITPFASGVAALTIVYSAYLAELIHGAVRNVPRGQFEACAALGLGALSAWRRVILPQLSRLALPGLLNLSVVVLKDTSLVSLAGLSELVSKAKVASGATQQPFVFFIGASVLFVGFTASMMPLADWLQAHLSRGYARSAS